MKFLYAFLHPLLKWNLNCALDCVTVEVTAAVRPSKHQQCAVDTFVLLVIHTICCERAAQIYHGVSCTRLGAEQ